MKSFISCNDWYKLSSIIFMLGNIDVKGFLKVSNIQLVFPHPGDPDISQVSLINNTSLSIKFTP